MTTNNTLTDLRATIAAPIHPFEVVALYRQSRDGSIEERYILDHLAGAGLAFDAWFDSAVEAFESGELEAVRDTLEALTPVESNIEEGVLWVSLSSDSVDTSALYYSTVVCVVAGCDLLAVGDYSSEGEQMEGVAGVNAILDGLTTQLQQLREQADEGDSE